MPQITDQEDAYAGLLAQHDNQMHFSGVLGEPGASSEGDARPTDTECTIRTMADNTPSLAETSVSLAWRSWVRT